jgi:feruloyl esterase
MTRCALGFVVAVMLACLLPATDVAAAPRSCSALIATRLKNGSILFASDVEAGQFVPPQGPLASPPAAAARDAVALAPDALNVLPAFCRMMAKLTPSSDSDIRVEVWLPRSGWNGKLEGVGNGGWAGSITYSALAEAVSRGYAAASTDTGHAGGMNDGQFAYKHPEKVVDFAYRAVHEMTLTAKALVTAYYGNEPRLSYWNGCSTGGKQGLTEAQRYPADYDAIIAGAPANFWTHLTTRALWVAHAALIDPATKLSAEKMSVLHRAVLQACDAQDGVRDGVIEDPTRCHVDLSTLTCKSGDSPECLTPAQIGAVRKIYAPAVNPRTGTDIFPGLEPGSELRWIGNPSLAGGPQPLQIADDYFKYVVYNDPRWDFRTFDFDKGLVDVEKADVAGITATDPDLRPFFKRGGKLLMYHGWTDQLIAPRNSINYCSSVRAKVGPEASKSIALFMVPGMNHCYSGGEGATTFDMVTAIEQWREHQVMPDRLPAARVEQGRTVRTRPLCPHPQTARYIGTGSTDDATNFRCEVPR